MNVYGVLGLKMGGLVVMFKAAGKTLIDQRASHLNSNDQNVNSKSQGPLYKPAPYVVEASQET